MKNKIQPQARSILIEQESIPYTLKYSVRAKYLRMQIKNRGELEVILPRGYKVTEAEKFLVKKAAWIKKHIRNKNNTENKYFLFGKEIRVTQEYDLFISKHKINFIDDHLKITSPSGAIKKTRDLFENWLRKHAKKSLVNRVHKIAGENKFKIRRVIIRGQKTRWGSCSTNGNLSFNYNLLQFRKEVIDYVIIHELCHLKEMNHSERFWKLVEGYCSDYKTFRNELKKHSFQA